jgi:hypothetical protein
LCCRRRETLWLYAAHCSNTCGRTHCSDSCIPVTWVDLSSQ